MLKLSLDQVLPDDAEILCIGAHSDDIEIGAGGTLARLLAARSDLSVSWVVCTAAGRREDEARNSASALLANAKSQRLLIETFRNGFFPWVGASIKEFFESLKSLPRPDLVLTHCRHDLHQDHRVVAELTWNTFRDHFILEYEIPKYDGDLGSPNAFVCLDEADLHTKTDVLMTHFPSQQDKHWFNARTFESLACLRGNECNSASGFAEAFYARKIVL